MEEVFNKLVKEQIKIKEEIEKLNVKLGKKRKIINLILKDLFVKLNEKNEKVIIKNQQKTKDENLKEKEIEIVIQENGEESDTLMATEGNLNQLEIDKQLYIQRRNELERDHASEILEKPVENQQDFKNFLKGKYFYI